MKRIILAIAMIIMITGCGSSNVITGNAIQQQSIKIGFIAPLTGPFADWGRSIQNGLDIALENTNHSFIVDYQDSMCDPKQTVTIAKKMIEVDKINIIIGPGCVTGLKAITPLAKNTVLFSTGLLDDQTVQENSNVINLATQISTEAHVIAERIKSKNITRTAIVHGTSYFGEEYGRRLLEALKERNIKVTTIKPVDLETTDFRSIITTIKETKPEAIFVHQGQTNTGLFIKQARELNYNIPIFSYYGTEAESVLKAGGKALEGVEYTYPYNSAEYSKPKQRFEITYKNRYNSTPTATSFFVYDGMQLIDKALNICEPTNIKCIKYFFENQEYEGISGNMHFEKDGKLSREFRIKTIKNQQFVWLNEFEH